MSKITTKLADERNEKLQRIGKLLQPSRLSKEESSLLAGIFGDSPDIYTAIRDLFFGFELDESQKEILKQVQAISGLIRKIFLPEVIKSVPFGNTFDLWQTKDLQTDNLEAGNLNIQSKEILIGFLATSLARLNNTELPGVDLTIKKELAFIHARNGYISYVDSQIRFLIQHSNMQTMSQEEISLLMGMNSTK